MTIIFHNVPSGVGECELKYFLEKNFHITTSQINCLEIVSDNRSDYGCIILQLETASDEMTIYKECIHGIFCEKTPTGGIRCCLCVGFNEDSTIFCKDRFFVNRLSRLELIVRNIHRHFVTERDSWEAVKSLYKSYFGIDYDIDNAERQIVEIVKIIKNDKSTYSFIELAIGANSNSNILHDFAQHVISAFPEIRKDDDQIPSACGYSYGLSWCNNEGNHSQKTLFVNYGGSDHLLIDRRLLYEIFVVYGSILDIDIPYFRCRDNNHEKIDQKYAFVHFVSDEDLENALAHHETIRKEYGFKIDKSSSTKKPRKDHRKRDVCNYVRNRFTEYHSRRKDANTYIQNSMYRPYDPYNPSCYTLSANPTHALPYNDDLNSSLSYALSANPNINLFPYDDRTIYTLLNPNHVLTHHSKNRQTLFTNYANSQSTDDGGSPENVSSAIDELSTFLRSVRATPPK
jgi:hypothetical protein